MAKIFKILRVLNSDDQKVIADLLGISVFSLSNKENGKSKFTIKEAQIIAERYNVSLDNLINGEKTKKKILELLQN